MASQCCSLLFCFWLDFGLAVVVVVVLARTAKELETNLLLINLFIYFFVYYRSIYR